MNKQEAKDLLIDRVGFRGETSLSGKTFEAEAAIITKETIRKVQPNIQITDEDFLIYLVTLRTDTIYQVLADVYDFDKIDESDLTRRPSLFDNAISMQMLIKVSNLILSSTRSNLEEVASKRVMQKLYFDLKGNRVNNKESSNFPITDGIEHKYRSEIIRIQNRTSNRRRLGSITVR